MIGVPEGISEFSVHEYNHFAEYPLVTALLHTPFYGSMPQDRFFHISRIFLLAYMASGFPSSLPTVFRIAACIFSVSHTPASEALLELLE
mgnify:CR=1 FL=1